LHQDSLIEKIIVRGNYQQCYYRGCQHKAQNGVGMLGHLETSHHKHHLLGMGICDIILEHLEHNHDATIADLIGAKEAIVRKHKGCGYVAVSERAMMAHNTIHLGKATASELAEDVVKEFVALHERFFGKRR
jgi:hypothetical protein